MLTHVILREPLGPLTTRIVHFRDPIASHSYNFTISRTSPYGVPLIHSSSLHSLIAGLGYSHARDRLTQLIMTRLIAQGRLSQHIKVDDTNSSDALLRVDLTSRQADYTGRARRVMERASKEMMDILNAYSAGINRVMIHENKGALPIELSLVFGALLSPEKPLTPWSGIDTVSIALLSDAEGLNSLTVQAKRLQVEMLQQGGDAAREFIQWAWGNSELPDPMFSSSNTEMMKLLKSVHLPTPWATLRAAAEVAQEVGSPAMTGSNNWAVSKGKSQSGGALYASDPHLRVDLLPSMLVESILELEDNSVPEEKGIRKLVGFAIPGTPAIVFGRSKHLSFGMTYGFIDTSDFWLEKCDAKNRSCSGEPWQERVERIGRKGKKSLTLSFYETAQHGVLETDLLANPTDPASSNPPDGVFLAMRPPKIDGMEMAKMIDWALSDTTVDQFQLHLREVELGCNWIIADDSGNIGYQLSGKIPKKIHEGSAVRPGWLSHYNWQDFIPSGELTRILNPEDGILMSANNDFNLPGKQRFMVHHFGRFRSNRIRQLLTSKDKIGVEDLKRIQADTVSEQCVEMMAVTRHLIQGTDSKSMALREFDCDFKVGSIGAAVYMEFWEQITDEIMGRLLPHGQKEIQEERMYKEFPGYEIFTPALHALIVQWPMALANSLLKGESQQQLIQKVLEKVATSKKAVKEGGYQGEFKVTHMAFMGQLPLWVGYDREVRGMKGCPTSISTFIEFSDKTVVSSAIRMVTDMSTKLYESVIMGGPSEKPFSGLYDTEMDMWKTHHFKQFDLVSSSFLVQKEQEQTEL